MYLGCGVHKDSIPHVIASPGFMYDIHGSAVWLWLMNYDRCTCTFDNNNHGAFL